MDDAASAPTRSATWTREAAPVLAAVEIELRRTEDVRQRWETSDAARRDGPVPGAVRTIVDRQDELGKHREVLGATMAAISVGPLSEIALANAWDELRAAQGTLRSLAFGRSALEDPVEAAVLRLAVDEGASPDSARGESSAPSAVTLTSFGPPEGGATTRPAVASERLAPAAPTAAPVLRRTDQEEPETDPGPAGAALEIRPSLAVESSRDDVVQDDAPEPVSPSRDPVAPEASDIASSTVPDADSAPTMLSFDLPMPSRAGEDESSSAEPRSGADTDALGSSDEGVTGSEP